MKHRLLTRAAAADRLCRGSALLLRRWEQRLTTWVRAGRRDDLTGWRAALGPLLRIALLAVIGLVAFGILRTARILMWLLTAWWVLAAWRAGRGLDQPAEKPSADVPEHAPEEVHAAVIDWVRQAVGDRQGVHLRDLLANGQQHGMFEGLDVPAFRALLEAAGIPVRKGVRVRGQGVTVGVHRDDLPAPAEAPSGAPSPADRQAPEDPRLHAA